MAEGFLRFVETCLNKIKRPNSITSEMQRWAGLLKSLRLARKKSRSNTMAVGDLKNSAGFLRFRERVGSRGREARDRVVSGPVARPLEGRHRTESGGGLVTATMEPLAMSQVCTPARSPYSFFRSTTLAAMTVYLGWEHLMASQVWKAR